ncbi:hypothetical protein [Marinilactibacillus piezotolerans]|nr:hypothetical protein [Marinilactibacillus piezotolerans]
MSVFLTVILVGCLTLIPFAGLSLLNLNEPQRVKVPVRTDEENDRKIN